MEYSKEDWPDEWNDPDRVGRGRFYDWRFWTLLAAALILGAWVGLG
jgi:hypothetical protein